MPRPGGEQDGAEDAFDVERRGGDHDGSVQTNEGVFSDRRKTDLSLFRPFAPSLLLSLSTTLSDPAARSIDPGAVTRFESEFATRLATRLADQPGRFLVDGIALWHKLEWRLR